MEIIKTTKAPEAIGPYSQAIKQGGFIFLSGQIGLDPLTGELKGHTLEEQAHQVFKNIISVLEASGSTLNDVVKTTLYLKNMDDFPSVNKMYAEYFSEHKPARATIEVARLPKEALIEIDCVAKIS
ncbi:RidA family protein [Candidatus Peregrinibacteria bacterium]|nr:RidA family protein [Candidatus Peregrinibacteria bacterium]